MPTISAIEDIYPSRSEPTTGWIERKDPVVYAAPDHWEESPLSPDQIVSFQENGFLFLENFFSGEDVDLSLRELDRLRSSEEIKSLPNTILEPAGDEVRSIFAVHSLSPLYDRLSRTPRLLDIVRNILGSEAYIHQSRINLKPGFEGKEFYWHSDFETWHMEDGMPRMRAVSCSIGLTENNPFNGPLMLIPGSHKHYISCIGETPEEHYKESLKKQEYGVPDHESLKRLVEEGGIQGPVGKAGSVVLFDCNTMHGSNSNISPWPRTNLFIVYNSMENTLVDPFCGLAPRPVYIASREFCSL